MSADIVERLPELPQRTGRLLPDSSEGTIRCTCNEYPHTDACGLLPGFDADDMRAYAAEAVRTALAERAAVPAQTLTGDVAWLWTHCRALGMARKSESGSLRDDVALFVVDLHEAASQKAAVPAQVVDIEALTDKVTDMLGGTYHCTRVWSAWHVGTMSEHDFEPVDESNTPREIAEAVAALTAQPAAAPAAQASESAWLVEWRFNGVQWLYLWPSAPGGFNFTGDANQALRFARREDAEAALQWARTMDSRRGAPRASGELLVTEHEWPLTAQPAAPSTPEGQT